MKPKAGKETFEIIEQVPGKMWGDKKKSMVLKTSDSIAADRCLITCIVLDYLYSA